MASSIQICNMALSHVMSNLITSFDNPTKEARTCKLLYEALRDEVLASNAWGFARKELSMALSSEVFTKWDYAYQWPTDCLVPRSIINQYSNDNTQRIPFDIGSNEAKNRRFILTNEVDAILEYTAKIEDTNMFDAKFVKALSYRIATDLAMPLRGKPDLRKDMYQAYVIEIEGAKAVSNNQGHKAPDDSNEFMDARA